MKITERFVKGWLLVLLCGSAAARCPAETDPPLYLLTYDHGGLVLWGTEHFAERLRNAVAWLDRHPGFKIGLDNEAYVYDYLAEQNPGLLEELRGYLGRYRGRLGVGSCTYGQPLSTFINDECNIRQIALALETDQRRLGCAPDIYLMSEHAMHSQIPQILSGLGFRGAILRTHFMMYGYNPVFDVPVGWWRGLDGSRIAAVPTYPGEGAEFGRTTVDNWFLTRFPGPEVKLSPEDFRRQFAQVRPLLATRADDSGLRKEELVSRYEGNPSYRWVLLEDLPGILPQPSAELLTLPNDFHVRMPWGYCGNRIWNLSRQAEAGVLTAERLAALELWCGGADRQSELERAWKALLVGQHHDIQICGLLPEAEKFLLASITGSSNSLASSLRALSAKLKAGGLAQVTVFNPVSWPRREWIEVELVSEQVNATNLVVQHQGRPVPSNLLEAQRSSTGRIRQARLVFRAELPPLAVAAYSILPNGDAPASPEKVWVDPENQRLRTRFYDARLDPHGGLAWLRDARTGRDLVLPKPWFAGRINGVDCESAGRWSLHEGGANAPWALAREYGFIGGIPYTFEICFAAESPRIDCTATFHFEEEKIGQVTQDRREARSPFLHEHKLRFRLFPKVGDKAIGIRDLPFAISETTNHYVEGLYWTALSDGQFGLAFFNRGTMGAVHEPDGAFSLPLAYSMFYIWGTRMLKGDFKYEFAFEPFAGDWREAELHRHALQYNFRPVSMLGSPGTGALGEVFQPFRFTSEDALVSALYPDGGQVYARLFAYKEKKVKVAIAAPEGKVRLHRTTLKGREQSSVPGAQLQPWEFGTFRLERLGQP